MQAPPPRLLAPRAPSRGAGLARIARIALVGLAAGGCDARVAHSFGGYPYDPVGDCLDAPVVIDVVAGPDPGPCAILRCWEDSCGAIYVTDTSCDTPPGYQDLTQSTSGPCVKALAAYGRSGHDLCPQPPDGGGPDGGLPCAVGAGAAGVP